MKCTRVRCDTRAHTYPAVTQSSGRRIPRRWNIGQRVALFGEGRWVEEQRRDYPRSVPCRRSTPSAAACVTAMRGTHTQPMYGRVVSKIVVCGPRFKSFPICARIGRDAHRANNLVPPVRITFIYFYIRRAIIKDTQYLFIIIISIFFFLKPRNDLFK